MKESAETNPKMVTSSELINILGVVYVHTKTSNGGDLYRTRYGLSCGEMLNIENWHEKEWFEANRVRLIGTSSVYRLPTKPVQGQSMQLVVKYSRVGEDVPLNTKTLSQFINAEFNSPWEEFSLVMEMREGGFGPKNISLRTQRPLAIYVPPEPMQLWQTGRSRHKINSIIQKHGGVSLDILRQYILVYEWIEGLNLVEFLESLGFAGDALDARLGPCTNKAIADMEAKGYAVADMKPQHVIIGEHRLRAIRGMAAGPDAAERQAELMNECVSRNDYSIIDYELLLRTSPHEAEVRGSRRHSYLDDQRDRFQETPLPHHLRAVEIMGVPYIHGNAESTGGLMWVVGRNARLFDYFLPERWRKTPRRLLSQRNEVYYTLTKDNINIVWRTSRVGEAPDEDEDEMRAERIAVRGFNSPFEICAVAERLTAAGVPTVYLRAIYMTGSEKIEPVADRSRFESHAAWPALDGRAALRQERNYVIISGYYNGPDAWVAAHESQYFQPVDLARAERDDLLGPEGCARIFDRVCLRLEELGFYSDLLERNDLLLSIDHHGHLARGADGEIEARICNLELLHPH